MTKPTPSVVQHRLPTAVVFVVAALATGCASAARAPDRQDIGDAIRDRTGARIRTMPGPSSLPPDVSLDEGMTREEAVAVALWNSPGFEASLAELGLARADLAEAGLLRNPILSLLFPIGPKQLEWTLQFPVEVLWQRPRRVAAASLAAQMVGERLVSEGLALAARVGESYVEASAAEQRVAMAAEHAVLTGRIAEIADARLRAGDISELEARAARSDAAQMNAERRALEHDRDLAKVALLALSGLDSPPEAIRLTPRASADPVSSCEAPGALIEAALASRPDVRAAEINVEAAGRRASWERSRVINLIAGLDANGQGDEGFEMGPGVAGEIPIFTRNQGGIGRAEAELERASYTYLAVRMQVAADIRLASIRFDRARQALEIWTGEIVPSLEAEQRQAEAAYQQGETALLSLLDVSRRLVQGRMRQLEASVDLQKAAVGLNLSVGHTCVQF